jgi:hypothetical protein
MKTFFHRIAAFFGRFKDVKWTQVASSTLRIAGPLAETLVALVAGEPAAAVLTDVINEIQTDLGAAAGLLASDQAATAAGASQVQALLGAVKSNLAQLLSAAQIKDAGTQAKVTAVVSSLTDEVDAILGSIPKAATSASAGSTVVVNPTAASSAPAK